MSQSSTIKKDLFVALLIGEAAAWLLLALGRQILPPEKYVALAGSLKFLPLAFPLICAVCLYAAFLLSKKIAVLYQAAKFVLVGGANTLFDWGILALLTFLFSAYLHIGAKDVLLVLSVYTIVYYSLYKSISFVLSACNSYLLNKFWTFRSAADVASPPHWDRPPRAGQHRQRDAEFIRFFLVTFIGFLINVAIASLVFKSVAPFGGLNLSQWGILAAVFATAISMFWNFVGYKFIVFK